MSILIRGMKMPSSCFECPCCNGENGYCQLRKEYVYGEVPRSCPLVHVPDHGRLIDADEIIKDDHQHYEYLSDTFYVTVRDIELAPTIIEEEVSE